MAGEKPDVLLIGAGSRFMVHGLEPKVTLHYLLEAKDPEAFIKSIGDKIRAIAMAYTANKLDAAFMQRFPKLEQISSFGVGYDHVDAKWAGAARHHRHQHAGRAQRGSGRHHARPAAVHGARISAGRTLSARRQVDAADITR